MDSVKTPIKTRFMQINETCRVSELVRNLQETQQMKNVSRIPDGQDLMKDLTHVDEDGNQVPNNRSTFCAVAIDETKTECRNGSELIGYLIYSISFSIRKGRFFYINSFFIEENYRQQGIGKKLIEFMRAHGRLLNLGEFDVPFMNANIRGQKFYKSYGAYLVNEEYQLSTISWS